MLLQQDIHPFYSALINVLYDKDHYKLALGQLNTVRNLIDNLSRDYVRMLKFGQNMFQCKQLKRAAMGRMCTLMRQQGHTLGYLEEVRKHLSRLPSIDPTTRTLLVCGYPNVGKSSFMNKVTRAECQVEPYAFTTKSLFVGHMDYRYIRWQVIDTPGILDHPLEQRNTIEMQAITAMAHLQCAVLYFIDLSEECGFSLEQQLDLFDNIKPVFMNKPLLIVANKIDRRTLDEIDPSLRARIDSLVTENKATLIPMSNFSEEGVMDVKKTACDQLLAMRVEGKHRSNKVSSIQNRVTITMPKPRDNKVREATIPDSVRRRREAAAAERAARGVTAADEADDLARGRRMNRVLTTGRKTAEDDESMDGSGRQTLRDLEAAAGGAGVFKFDWKNHRLLKNDDWKFDIMPEFMDGKNVADFVSADVEAKLLELERLEDEDMRRLELEEMEAAAMASDEDPDSKRLADAIRDKKRLMRKRHREERNKNRAPLPHKHKTMDAAAMRDHLESVGLESGAAVSTALARGRTRERKRQRNGLASKVDEEEPTPAERAASKAMRRSVSRAPSQGDGLKDDKQRAKTAKHGRKAQKKYTSEGRKGEGDRFIGTKMPRHLFSGKRGVGKTDRR